MNLPNDSISFADIPARNEPQARNKMNVFCSTISRVSASLEKKS